MGKSEAIRKHGAYFDDASADRVAGKR